MNPRIRELFEKAVIAVDNPFPGNPLNGELEKMYIPDCFAEKFAELIVRECLGKVAEADNARRDPMFAYRQIEKHFGVES